MQCVFTRHLFVKYVFLVITVNCDDNVMYAISETETFCLNFKKESQRVNFASSENGIIWQRGQIIVANRHKYGSILCKIKILPW